MWVCVCGCLSLSQAEATSLHSTPIQTVDARAHSHFRYYIIYLRMCYKNCWGGDMMRRNLINIKIIIIFQIIFDGFSVGRFDEGLVEGELDSVDASLSPAGELPGCPEGFMQVLLYL